MNLKKLILSVGLNQLLWIALKVVGFVDYPWYAILSPVELTFFVGFLYVLCGGKIENDSLV